MSSEPYAEIAGILEVPTGTVTSRIARGRRLLQKALATSRLATRPGGATQAEE
jgi:DNA-directed RNA polymerase specialized sigma24 family protein